MSIELDASHFPKGLRAEKLHTELADALGDAFAHVGTSSEDGTKDKRVVTVGLTREPTDADKKAVAKVVAAHKPGSGPAMQPPLLVNGTVDGRKVVAKVSVYTIESQEE